MYYDTYHVIAKCRSQKVARAPEMGEEKSALRGALLIAELWSTVSC